VPLADSIGSSIRGARQRSRHQRLQDRRHRSRSTPGSGGSKAEIRAMNGNNYRVRIQTGTEVTKTYPAEVRRLGRPTTRDRAAGRYIGWRARSSPPWAWITKSSFLAIARHGPAQKTCVTWRRKTRGGYVRRAAEARADELRRESLANQDMPTEINHDRTLQTPFGEIKKKGN
jgi:hypothetical protein